MASRTINVKVGRLPDPSFPMSKVCGAWINWAPPDHPHPTITEQGIRDNMIYFDGQLATNIGRTGKQLAGPHGYAGGGNWPTTFANSGVGWAPADGWSHSWMNMHISGTGGGATGWQAAANGSYDNHLINYVNSVPEGHTHVLLVSHEPENNVNGGPSEDGGAYEAAYADWWCRMQARFAEIMVDLDRDNVFLAVCLMAFTFPVNGPPGSLGPNQRDPRKWNAWKYMSDAAKDRTIFAPDGYTAMKSSSYETMATEFGKVRNYVDGDDWDVRLWGVTEHTINNDVGRTPAAVANVWASDARPYLRNWSNLAYYLVFNASTGLASGDDGWVDNPEEYSAFGKMVREFNHGEVIP